jgi:multicomponent Na+:H+ antiporter subunit D
VIYTNLPALVLATPLVLACLCFAFARRRRVVQLVSLLGVVGWLAMAANLAMQVHAQGTMVTEVGGWDRHYGISFVADQLGAMMVVLAAFIQLAVGLAAHARLDRKAEAFWYHGLTYCLAFGVTGAFLTADLFNLFVWFEVLLISSFVLMVHGGSDRQLAGGMKYVTLNLISSVMFLAGCGLTYAHTGTLSFVQLAQVGIPDGPAALLVLAFMLKASVVPLAFWMPASYPAAPTYTIALFSALLTKVGCLALLRTLGLLQNEIWYTVLGIGGVLSILVGSFGLIGQANLRRMLAFSSVSQVGYIAIAIALQQPAVVALLIVNHALAKGGLFLVAGEMERLTGQTNYRDMRGLAERAPALTWAFAVLAASLAGLPPTLGFFAKWDWLSAMADRPFLVILGLVGSAATLYGMVDVYLKAFAAPSEEPLGEDVNPLSRRRQWLMNVGLGSMVVALVALSSSPVVNDPVRQAGAAFKGPLVSAATEEVRP